MYNYLPYISSSILMLQGVVYGLFINIVEWEYVYVERNR